MYPVDKLVFSESDQLLVTVGSYISIAPLFYYRFVRVIARDLGGLQPKKIGDNSKFKIWEVFFSFFFLIFFCFSILTDFDWFNGF